MLTILLRLRLRRATRSRRGAVLVADAALPRACFGSPSIGAFRFGHWSGPRIKAYSPASAVGWRPRSTIPCVVPSCRRAGACVCTHETHPVVTQDGIGLEPIGHRSRAPATGDIRCLTRQNNRRSTRPHDPPIRRALEQACGRTRGAQPPQTFRLSTSRFNDEATGCGMT